MLIFSLRPSSMVLSAFCTFLNPKVFIEQTLCSLWHRKCRRRPPVLVMFMNLLVVESLAYKSVCFSLFPLGHRSTLEADLGKKHQIDFCGCLAIFCLLINNATLFSIHQELLGYYHSYLAQQVWEGLLPLREGPLSFLICGEKGAHRLTPGSCPHVYWVWMVYWYAW